MTQFSVYKLRRSGDIVVDIQADLLADLKTRVVIPLVARHEMVRPPLRTLNPIFTLDGLDFVLMTQEIVAVLRKQIGARIGSLAPESDRITRAIDMLLAGI